MNLTSRSLTNASRETKTKLEAYVSLLKKWNSAVNLVSAASLTHVWTRHIADSAQLLDLVDQTAARWADLGSGGGLPGMVVAILAEEKMPSMRATLIESDQRKCAFLRTVRQELSLEMTIVADRIENCPPLVSDIVSARALSPLVRLLPHAARHLKPSGKALFLKGSSYMAEIEDARRTWSFSVKIHPSITDPTSAVLDIRQISRAG